MKPNIKFFTSPFYWQLNSPRYIGGFVKFFLFLISFSFLALADIQNIAELKTYFLKFEPAITKAWDRAAQMKSLNVVPTKEQEINLAECLKYEDLIKKQYKNSPFEVKFKGGVSTHAFCRQGGTGSTYIPESFYFQKAKLKNQFGLAIDYILQSKNRSGFVQKGLLTFYLDSNYKIVEISSVVQTEATVISVDAQGNRFLNTYRTTNPKEVHSRQSYSAADGSVINAVKIIRNRRADQGKGVVELRIFDQVDVKDWDNFELLPTFSIDGGFYNYGSEIYDRPASYNRLITYWIGKKNVCSEGEMWSSHKVLKTFAPPATEAEMGYCGNTW